MVAQSHYGNPEEEGDDEQRPCLRDSPPSSSSYSPEEASSLASTPLKPLTASSKNVNNNSSIGGLDLFW